VILVRRNRVCALVTLAVGALCVLVSWAAVGNQGPASAFLGLVMVLVFFSVGAIPLAVVGDGSSSGFAFMVLAMTYVLRILLGVVVYVIASDSPSIDRQAVGLTVIACALAWVNTQVVLGLSRKHQPTLEV
jgi:ATP synthase protein I